MEPIQLAAVLAAVVLVASMPSVELGITVALIELTLGVVAGNVFVLQSQEWLDFIATFASIVPHLPRRDGSRHRLHARPRQGDRWCRHRLVRRPLSRGDARLLPRTRLVGPRLADRRHGALDDLALAVVYAVLVERDLRDTRIGKLLMSATFVTDLCTALALSAIFLKPNGWFPAFLVVSLTLILVLPRISPWFFARYGDRVIEPEIMSTGLTFGTISALFGLNAGIIDTTQFSLLVTVVVLSAIVPTAIAERWFLPDAERERHEERRHAPFPAEEYV